MGNTTHRWVSWSRTKRFEFCQYFVCRHSSVACGFVACGLSLVSCLLSRVAVACGYGCGCGCGCGLWLVVVVCGLRRVACDLWLLAVAMSVAFGLSLVDVAVSIVDLVGWLLICWVRWLVLVSRWPFFFWVWLAF